MHSDDEQAKFKLASCYWKKHSNSKNS